MTFGNADSIVLNAAMNITGTLTINAGRVVTGVNMLTLGTSPATPGTLVHNGGVITGTFKRWIAAAATTGSAGLFPMGRSGTGERRLATVEFTTPPTIGGSLTAFLDSASINSITTTVTTDGTCPSGFTVSSLVSQYLTITADDGLAGGVYSLTLQFENPGSISNLCQLAIAKRPDENGTWGVDGMQDFASGSVTEPIVRHTGLSGFSDFILAGSSGNPLPISLSRFEAAVRGQAVKLSWLLEDMVSVDRIHVERSTDGRKFASIGSMHASGNEGAFVDETPASGQNHYRLRLINPAGGEWLSAVRTVVFNEKTNKNLTVFPNPASDVLLIHGSAAISAKLCDVTGRPIRSVSTVSNDVTIPLHGVSNGFYLLRATDGTNTIQERIQVLK